MGNYNSDQKNARFYGLKLSRNTDADLIQHLEQQESMQGYLKRLIREDMMKEERSMNICTITSNSSYGREYEVSTTSAMKAAEQYGRAEGGEIVTVATKSGKILSRVEWSTEQRKYIRVSVID